MFENMRMREYDMMEKNPTVFITGASGSLGYRLAEVLSLEMNLPVIAQAHSLVSPGRARLARLQCSVITGAFGTHGDGAHKRNVTVEGTRRMLEASVRNGIKRFIHLSTAAVVGYKHQTINVGENEPYHPCGDTYIDSKIEAEKVALSYTESLPVVILRPTRIYGPRCDAWTFWPIYGIREGSAWLTDGGSGNCPLVYVDNVVEAIICAMMGDEGDGEVFFITDEEKITWARLYEDYCRIVGPGAHVKSVPVKEIYETVKSARRSIWKDSLCGLTRMAGAGLHQLPREVPVVRRIVDLLPRPIVRSAVKSKRALRKAFQQSSSTPSELNFLTDIDPGDLRRKAEAHTSHSVIVIDKLKRELGYRQIVSYIEGMRLTGEWARYARLTNASRC